MKTCKRGHPVPGKRCRICVRDAQKRWEARRFTDSLTPQERLKQARGKWS